MITWILILIATTCSFYYMDIFSPSLLSGLYLPTAFVLLLIAAATRLYLSILDDQYKYKNIPADQD